ncbi:MAG: flippase-like domain-containing protein, partial [Thermoplasmata archaeon]
MKCKLIIGFVFSGFFLYLAFKGINTSELRVGLKQADYCYLVPIFLLSIFILYLRSLRWGIILNPLERISQKVLFPITAVGLMAVVLLPVRMGELARPLLVSKRSEIRISSALGTIVL